MFYRGMDHLGNLCNGSGMFFNPWSIMIGVIAIAVVVVLAVVLVKAFKKKDNSRENEALDLLKTKYAAGEITEAEYLQKKKILGE